MIDPMVPGDPLDYGWAHQSWQLQMFDAIAYTPEVSTWRARYVRNPRLPERIIDRWVDAQYEAGTHTDGADMARRFIAWLVERDQSKLGFESDWREPLPVDVRVEIGVQP